MCTCGGLRFIFNILFPCYLKGRCCVLFFWCAVNCNFEDGISYFYNLKCDGYGIFPIVHQVLNI